VSARATGGGRRATARWWLPAAVAVVAAVLAGVGAAALLAGRHGVFRWDIPLPAAAFVAPVGMTAHPLRSPVGLDASWPQCHDPAWPGLAPGFAVVGLTGGRPFTAEPCAAVLSAAAGSARGVGSYANLAAPRTGRPAAYGAAAGRDAVRRARALRVPFIWFDVETANYWRTPGVDVAVIRAALAAVRAAGLGAGVYTAPALWQQIAGPARIRAPLWLATASPTAQAAAPRCRKSFAGERPTLVQFVVHSHATAVDGDLACPGASPRRLFRLPASAPISATANG